MSTLKFIKEQATASIRDTISQQFVDPAKLDELPLLISELEKKLQTAESKLNSAVQSKLDSLKRSVDLMDESSLKLSKLSSSMNRVDKKIEETNSSIANFEYLSKVHNARENIEKTIKQVEFFARVPKRVAFLRNLMDENPAKLKEVYLESLKLESLKTSVIKELRISRFRKRSTTIRSSISLQEEHERKQEQSNCSTESSMKTIEDRATLRTTIEGHLSIVPELVKDVRMRTFDTISRMWDLASTAPEVLVSALEIIEMQQEYNDRREVDTYGHDDHNSLLTEPSTTSLSMTNSSPKEDGSKSHYHEDIRGLVQGKIRHSLEEKVEQEFEMLNQYSNDENLSPTAALTMAANGTLQKMLMFKVEVLPCIPPSYNTLLTFIEIFEKFLIPRIETLMKDIHTLKVSDIVDIINWLEYHSTCMHEFGCGDRACLTDLKATKHELLTSYKHRIKNQVNDWFDNIKKQPLEIMKDSDNTLISSNPEDMFNIIHMQLQVANEKLPSEYSKEVAIACLQVLRDVQRQSYDTLSEQWRAMDPEAMCATINDNQRMQEKCDEFGEKLISFYSGSSKASDDPEEIELGDGELDQLRAIIEEVSSEYIALAVHAVGLLARCILEDLDEPFFSQIYLRKWEDGESYLCKVLIATLSDYFGDVKIWLCEYFFSKFVKETMDITVSHYVMALRRKVLPSFAFAFNDPRQASARIREDHDALLEFFETHLDSLVKGGINATDKMPSTKSINPFSGSTEKMDPAHTALMEALKALLTLASFLVTGSGARFDEGAKTTARYFYAKWGADGLRAVQACYYCDPSLSKVDRLASIEAAKGLFATDNAELKAGYRNKLLDEYAGYDAIQYPSAARTAGGGISPLPPDRPKNFWTKTKANFVSL